MRPSLLRLVAIAAAGATVLPALPAAAGGPGESGGRPQAPQARGLDLACPDERVPDGGFLDADGSVHAAAIDCLAFYGVTKGDASGAFGTGRAVTRAQLATFLARVLDEAGVALPDAPADAFSDDDGSAHEASLDALAALEVVNGAGDGTVSPDQPVRRDQMASFLVRLLELVTDEELAETLEDYFDDTDGSVHRGPINALAGLGIAAGRAKGIFDPSREVTREQMATFLMRLIDRLVEKGDVRVPASVTLSSKKASPGEVVYGLVVGEDVTAVALRGCGFDGVVGTPVAPAPDPLTDRVTATSTATRTATSTATTVAFTFQVTAPDAWPATEETGGDAEEADEDTDEVTDELTAAGRGEGGKGNRGRGDECEFDVLVTFADGSIEELEAELTLRGPEQADEDDEDDEDDDEREDDDEDDEDDEGDDDEDKDDD